MKKRTELKILAALASIAAFAALCSGSEAVAQQRFKDALYESPNGVTKAEQKVLDDKTDSLIAKTRRLEVFHVGGTKFQVTLPQDVQIRIYDDPRNFLYDHSNLTWMQIDNIFWRGPWAYYGPYGAFGPYNRSGWGYLPYEHFYHSFGRAYGPYGYYGSLGYPYMSSWAGWYGGPMYGYGYNGLADYPFYGGIYDLSYYDYAFSPWWWGGFYDGGFDCMCFCDPWFYGGPYHHNHVYLEGRPMSSPTETGRTGNRLSAPQSSNVASTGRGGSSGRSSVAGTPVSSASSTGRTAAASVSRSGAEAVSRSGVAAAPVNGLVSSGRSGATTVSRGDVTSVSRSGSGAMDITAYRRASSGTTGRSSSESVSGSTNRTSVSDYSRSRGSSVFSTDSNTGRSSVSDYSGSSRSYSSSSSSGFSSGSGRSGSSYSGGSSSYSGGSSSGRSSSSSSGRR